MGLNTENEQCLGFFYTYTQITKTLQYLLGEEHVQAEMSDLILYLLILSLSSFTSFLLLTLAYTHSDLLEKTTVPEYKHVVENT